MKKRTIEEIKAALPEFVTLVESTYVNTNIKAQFIDRDYGAFWKDAYTVMSTKCGHPKRGQKAKGQARKSSYETLRAKLPDYLDFDYSTYENNKLPVKFFDSEFGEFWGNMSHALNGQSNHPDRLKLKFRKALDKHYSSIEGNYDLPDGVTLKEGQTLPQNKQTEKRIFIDEKFGEFESSYFSLQQRDASLHPMSKQERISTPEFKDMASERGSKSWKKYGDNVDNHPAFSKSANKKRVATCLKKYGTENPLCSPKIQEKAKNSIKEKYDLTTPEKTKQYYKDRSSKAVQKKYGVDNISQIPEIRLKAAKSARKIIEIIHWKTSEAVPCYGTWEYKVAEYFNNNKIDYEKEKKVFKLQDLNQTYTPDFYLPDQDLFIEVKGRVYDVWQKKWNSFQKLGLKAEIWDKKILKEKGIKVK